MSFFDPMTSLLLGTMCLAMIFCSVMAIHFLTAQPTSTPQLPLPMSVARYHPQIHKMLRLAVAVAHIAVIWSGVLRLSAILMYHTGWEVGDMEAVDEFRRGVVIAMVSGTVAIAHGVWLMAHRPTEEEMAAKCDDAS